MIRPAQPDDWPALVAIYNHYAENTHVTFDTRAFSTEERRGWFEQFGTGSACRLLLAVAGGSVLGYACSTPLKPKPAYSISVETSVYLDPESTGRGLGGRLLSALLDELGGADVHGAYAQIALPNDPSVALHESLGFRHVGTLREVGRKFGRYWDVAWYERRIP